MGLYDDLQPAATAAHETVADTRNDGATAAPQPAVAVPLHWLQRVAKPQPATAYKQRPALRAAHANTLAANADKSVPVGALVGGPNEYDPAVPNDFNLCLHDAKKRKRDARNSRKSNNNNHNHNNQSTSLDTWSKLASTPSVADPHGNGGLLGSSSSSLPTAIDNDQDDDFEDIDGIPLDSSLLPPTNTTTTVFNPAESGDDAYSRRIALSATAANVLTDTSGDDAYLRRTQMSLQPNNSNPNPTTQYHKQPPSLQKHTLPSRVILLLNMVTPSQVDADLSDETAQECSKFGKVVAVRVHVLSTPPNKAGTDVDNHNHNDDDDDDDDDGAVRIFVKFESLGDAVEARGKMDGRFFGGRNVSAVFYDEGRFDGNQLNL